MSIVGDCVYFLFRWASVVEKYVQINGQNISEDRLCDSSPVFEAMLKGPYEVIKALEYNNKPWKLFKISRHLILLLRDTFVHNMHTKNISSIRKRTKMW